MAIDLSSIKRGPAGKIPLKMVLAGDEGVGKTTFACSGEWTKPGTVGIVPIEPGVEPLIKCERLPETLTRFPAPANYGDCVEIIDYLMTVDHGLETIVWDSLDWMEQLVWDETVRKDAYCQKTQETSIESVLGGFHKGYTATLIDWVYLLKGFDALAARKGMNVILLAHLGITKEDDPSRVGPIGKVTTKLNKLASEKFTEWADIQGIARLESTIKSDTVGAGKGTKTVYKAVGDVQHTLYFAGQPAMKAKNRWNLPHQMPLDWNTFAAAAKLT